MPSYNLVKFSDGSALGTVDGSTGHSIFNANKGMFTHLNSKDTPLNTNTINQHKDVVELVSIETVNKEIEFYNVITHSHINLFANGILTSSTLNNIYPIEDMKFVKENAVQRRRDEFDVTDDLYEGLRLEEQPRNYKNLTAKIEMMKNQMKI
jgi:hypothetical protein